MGSVGRALACGCRQLRAGTKTRGRAAECEWLWVSNLTHSAGVRPLMVDCWAPKFLEGLLEELLAALRRDGSRI